MRLATSTSGSSPAAPTGWPTSSGTPTTCQRTAARRSSTSPRAGARSGSGARARATSSQARRATTSRTRAFRSPPAARSRWARCGCWPRASPTSATSAGSSTSRSSRARRLWDIVWEAGQPHGVVPAGIGVYGTTGRLEKCYRAFGFELDGEYDVVEAGHGLGQGQGAGLRRQGGARAPARGGAGGGDVHADRRRPQRRTAARRATCSAASRCSTRDGAPLIDAKGRRSFVTSAGRRARRSASTS